MPIDYGYFEEKQIGKPYDVKMLKRLLPFAKPYRLMLFGSVLLVMLITLLDLSLPYVTKIAIDRYIVPVRNLDLKSGGPDGTAKVRYLKVDLNEAEIRAVVRKNQDLFQQTGAETFISLDALAHLSKKDLVLLRKTDLTGLGLITGLFLVLVLANFAFNFLQVMVMETSGQKMMHDLRSTLFAHIQDLSISFFTRNPVGRLVTRVTNDIQNMNELFTSVISFVFKDLFLLIGIAIVLISISWKLALISFAVLPLVAFASIKFSSHARDAFRELRIKIAEINTRISETLGGISVIQLFGFERKNYQNFKKLNHEYYQAGMRQIQIFAIFMPTIEFLGVVALAIVIYYGGGGVLAGGTSLGALVAFISYVKMFFRPIRDIAEKYNILQNAMASAERIFLILDNDEKLPEPVLGRDPSAGGDEKIRDIEIRDVSFSYISGEPVLKQVNLRMKAGEIVAIVGPTGSGKTTLVNLIPRFYDPTVGRVLINGRDIQSIRSTDLRSKIALVTQDPFLFSLSIRENIFSQAQDISDAHLGYILTASNCKTLIEKLPEGIDTVLSEGGGSISSGERQLLSIARALAHDPDLIIFDEATSYIDSETEQKIQNALFNLTLNRTAIIVAHRLTTARHADRIIVLNRGRVIETGSHPELMEQKGFYFRLSQMRG